MNDTVSNGQRVAPELINKEALAKMIKSDQGCKNKGVVLEWINIIFGKITDLVDAGHRVRINEFGTFDKRRYEGKNARNPTTNEPLAPIPHCRVIFTAAEALKDRINGKGYNKSES